MEKFEEEKNLTQYEKMTEKPLAPLIVSLAIPTTITMLISSLYNLADTYFVSQLGASASGATGIVFTVMAILQAFGFMYGQGAGSNISRRLGAKDVESAGRFASTSFFLALGTGLLISCLGLSFLVPLLRLLGSTATILPYSKAYAMCILIAAPLYIASYVMNNILRFEGRAVLAMIGLLTGALINIALDPLLIFGCDMGILGAGLATALSQCISFTILLSMFLRKKTQSRLSIRRISKRTSDYINILKTGFPSLVRQSLNSVSSMLLNIQAAVYGDVAIAAMSIVGRCCMTIFSIGIGIGQGFQPVSGFNYGAGRYERVKRGCMITMGISFMAIGVLAISCIAGSDYLINHFCDEEGVGKIGVFALRLQCMALLTAPITMCANMLFQSTGHAARATMTAAMRSGICFIPLILVLPGIIGLRGIQIAQPLSDLITAVVSIPLLVDFFRRMPKEIRT